MDPEDWLATFALAVFITGIGWCILQALIQG